MKLALVTILVACGSSQATPPVVANVAPPVDAAPAHACASLVVPDTMLVYGRVTDRKTGEPLAGVTIIASTTAKPSTPIESISDKNGCYMARLLRAGQTKLEIYYADYAGLQWIGADLGRATLRDIEIEPPVHD